MSAWQQRLDDDTAALYPIGVVADLLDASVPAIRRYDEEGVVEPTRSEGGQRRYSRRDIARLAHALELADDGIPLAGIKRILHLEDRLADSEARSDDEPGDDLAGGH